MGTPTHLPCPQRGNSSFIILSYLETLIQTLLLSLCHLSYQPRLSWLENEFIVEMEDSVNTKFCLSDVNCVEFIMHTAHVKHFQEFSNVCYLAL